MQVESLNISRRPSYDIDFPSQLVGLVKLKSDLGTQELRISNAGLGRIFELISEEVANTAKANAARTKNAILEAIHEPLISNAQLSGLYNDFLSKEML